MSLLCMPEFSPHIVGTIDVAEGTPETLKASMEHNPPSSSLDPRGPEIVNTSKSNLRLQTSKDNVYAF